MSAARRRHRIDLSFGPGHGAVSGVLNAAGAALGGTMLLYLGHGSAWWGLTAGVLIAFAGVLVAAWYEQPGRVLAYRAGCWAAAGIWSGWTLSGFQGIPTPFGDFRLLTWFWSPGNPWAWRPFYGLLIGTAVAAFVGWSIERAEKRAEELAAAKAAQKEADRLAAEADALANRTPVNDEEAIAFGIAPTLKKITKKDLRIEAVEIWPPVADGEPSYGYTLDLVLPDDGSTIRDIKPFEEALASAMDLNDGCGVEIISNPGMGRRNILMRVTTVNALGQDIHHPDELEQDSIENPQPIGVVADRTVKSIPMRYESVVLIGNTDSGKSNQLNAIITRLACCTDALKVGIDLSGNGRVFRPWLRPYREGRADKPVFAQVAPTEHRARLLCASLIQIIDGRTAEYAELMYHEGTDKIMVRPEIPQIELVIDEFGKLPDDVKDMVKTITDTGRGAGVRVVSCALEATGTYIPRAIITQSRVRLGMRVVDETQLQYLFDSTWSRGRFDPASMPWKGSGLVADGPQFPDRFKGYRVDPRRIDQIAVKTGDWQPELDEVSLRLGDTVTVKVMGADGLRYDQQFTGVWSNAEAETYPLIFPATQAGAGGRTTAAAAGGTTATIERKDIEMPGQIPDLGAATNSLNAALERARQEADKAEQGQKDRTDDDAQGGDDRGDRDDEEVRRLNALLNMPAAEPVRPRQQQTPPDGPPAPVTPQNTQGKPAPKRRVLQLIKEAAQGGGTGPGDIHAALLAEGYGTSLTTVNNWLREFKAAGRIVQPGGDRTPYLPGPNIDDAGQGR